MLERDAFFDAKFVKGEDGELHIRDDWNMNAWILERLADIQLIPSPEAMRHAA